MSLKDQFYGISGYYDLVKGLIEKALLHGETALYFKRKYEGNRCPNCYDEFLGQSDAGCPNCFGTTYDGGFYEPKLINVAYTDATNRIDFLESGILVVTQPTIYTTQKEVRTGDLFFIEHRGLYYTLEPLPISIPVSQEERTIIGTEARCSFVEKNEYYWKLVYPYLLDNLGINRGMFDEG